MLLHNALAAIHFWAGGSERVIAYDNALLSVATVSAVIWTGGFVLRTIAGRHVEKSDVPLLAALMFTMDFLQTAFMGAILGLIATPMWIQIASILYLLVYVPGEVAYVQAARRDRSADKPLGFTWAHLAQRFRRNVGDAIQQTGPSKYIWQRILLHGGVVLALFFPTTLCVSLVTWMWTLLGMWNLSLFVYAELLTSE